MRIVSAALFLVIAFTIFSCQKEKSFEIAAPATGSLKSDATGECLPKTAVGAFIAGDTLTDSNYLEVEVDVATEGSYVIRTDTINGYSFYGSGAFTQMGTNRIRLAASGTPIAAGHDQFTVMYDTSFCLVPVTVLPAGSARGPADFTLQGSGDTCMIAAVAGAYVQNVALTAANTVAIKVNATKAGTYSVTTNAVNGFSFSGTGTIAAPGEQTITLTGSGTPASADTTVFTVSAGNTTCTFTVNITASTGEPPVNTDHFPLSANSYWTYDVSIPGSFLDTTLRRNAGTATGNGQTYQVFIQSLAGRGDTSLYRKDGNNYYTLGPVDAFTQITLDTPQYGEIIFLKEGLTTGDTWNSDEYSGTDGGKAVTFKYVYTCSDANGSVTVNGRAYSDVYIIDQKVEGTLDGSPYVPEGGAGGYTLYYAKGVGLIQAVSQSGGVTDLEIKLRTYEVY